MTTKTAEQILDDLGVGAARKPANDDERHTWRRVDLGPVLDGTWRPPKPTVGARDDDVGLFYSGKLHTISSESEAGKSWFALAACAHELRAGNAVIYLDFEDDEGGVVGRLLTIGADPEAIRERFGYIRPLDRVNDGFNAADLRDEIEALHPTLVIIDGVTESMVMHGLNPLDNKEIAEFGRLLPRLIASTGAAVVCLDHVVKDREGRGRYSLGGVHKLNGLDGAAFVLENRQPFGIGITGRSTIRIAKDRPGQLRRHALPHGSGLHWFGDIVLTSHDETYADLEITSPREQDPNFRPTHNMTKVASLVGQQPDGVSGKRVQDILGGNAANNRKAIAYLILDGYITESPHKLIKPYPPEEDDEHGDQP